LVLTPARVPYTSETTCSRQCLCASSSSSSSSSLRSTAERSGTHFAGVGAMYPKPASSSNFPSLLAALNLLSSSTQHCIELPVFDHRHPVSALQPFHRFLDLHFGLHIKKRPARHRPCSHV